MAGVIDLDEVVQDGIRVRAAAGTGSFRRRRSFTRSCARRALLADCEGGRRTTRRPVAGACRRRGTGGSRAPGAGEAALAKLGEIEAERERRQRTNKKQVEKQREPRASTTDAEARLMKMADGGFRPAYNCQIGSVADGQIVVAVKVETVGSDRGLMRPMLQTIERLYRPPAEASSRRRRLQQQCRYRMGSRAWHRGLWASGAQPVQDRPYTRRAMTALASPAGAGA